MDLAILKRNFMVIAELLGFLCEGIVNVIDVGLSFLKY